MLNFTTDPFDPRCWSIEEPEGRIYLNDHLEPFVSLDYEDYLWACKWRWSIKHSRGENLIYAYRTLTEGSIKDGTRRKRSLYLHVEIMKRSGILPPSEKHTIVDHRDSNTLNCRRRNLRWATPSMNAKNRNGRCPQDLFEEI